MASSEPMRASVRGLGNQLFLLAQKMASGSIIGHRKEALLKAAPALGPAVDSAPHLKGHLFFEELLFGLWAIDLHLKDKRVATAMFTAWIEDGASRGKGSDIEKLSLRFRELYIQRDSAYRAALQVDAEGDPTTPTSAVITSKLRFANLALPERARIPESDIALLFLLKAEWASHLKLIQTSIDNFQVPEDKLPTGASYKTPAGDDLLEILDRRAVHILLSNTPGSFWKELNDKVGKREELAHMGIGQAIRNCLRMNGFRDDECPSGNLDDVWERFAKLAIATSESKGWPEKWGGDA